MMFSSCGRLFPPTQTTQPPPQPLIFGWDPWKEPEPRKWPSSRRNGPQSLIKSAKTFSSVKTITLARFFDWPSELNSAAVKTIQLAKFARYIYIRVYMLELIGSSLFIIGQSQRCFRVRLIPMAFVLYQWFSLNTFRCIMRVCFIDVLTRRCN